MLKRELIKAAAICMLVIIAATVIGTASGRLSVMTSRTNPELEPESESAPLTEAVLNDPSISEQEGISEAPAVESEEPPATPASPTPKPDYTTATLAVAGDLVPHSGLNEQARQEDGTYDYSEIFADAKPLLKDADYAVCCLETTFPNTTDYSGYPTFKSPEGLAETIADIGIDMVSLASNHAMDSFQAGIKRTIEMLDKHEIAHVGTYATQEDRDKSNGIVTVDIGDISAAILAYTYGTNGIPVNDFSYALNIYRSDYMSAGVTVDYDLLDADMEAARALDCDIIIVYMHWSKEYNDEPNDEQLTLTDYLFEQGATIILGGHPHVIQPMETRELTGEDGSVRTGFVCNCLGNFVSCQELEYTDLSVILNITLQRDNNTGITDVRDVTYTPMFMTNLSLYGASEDSDRYFLRDIHGVLDSYTEGGETPKAMYDDMEKGLSEIHTRLGEEYDSKA